jgi:undecaprenyl-diphosphatase
MHSPTMDAPSHPQGQRTALRSAGVVTVCSVLLLILVAVRWHPLMSFDKDIATTTHHWAVDESGLTHAFRILTDWVWDPWTMRLLCAVVALWLMWRRQAWWTALWLGITCLLGTLLQQGLKAAVDRPRPVWRDPVDSAHYAAYPSGHAMTATVVCGLLLWLLHHHGADRRLFRAVLAVSLVSVVGVGVTRIWLGVHWTSDVVGGWLLGVLVVAVAVFVHARRKT